MKTVAEKLLGKNTPAPLTYTPEILVAIPRDENRVPYGITSDVFIGYDVWNCYEVSFLNKNGVPNLCIAKISYGSDSEFIVESKSLKLYLNSFNMERIDAQSLNECKDMVRVTVANDLSELLQTEVKVELFEESFSLSNEDFLEVNDIVDMNEMSFDKFDRAPEVLHGTEGPLKLRVPYLRSNCKVTNQPDWGVLLVVFNGDKSISPESILEYVASFRNENHFHEEVCEMIFKDFSELVKDFMVMCLYTRRGGIDINPVRTDNPELIAEYDMRHCAPIKEFNQ